MITGSSSGIGKEILKKLLDFDVKIVAGSIYSSDHYTDIFDERIISFDCDLSKKTEIKRLFDFAKQELGTIDILFANAGFAYYEKIKAPDYEHIEKIYNTNVFAPIYMSELMADINHGREYKVVITCSAMGKLPIPGYALYSSTKAALDSFFTAYRHELENKKTICLVYPIATKTNFFNVAGDNTPQLFPIQRADSVAKSIIAGVLKDKQSVYPSKIFVVFNLILNRVAPFINYFYVLYTKRKFFAWLRKS
ncbi:MAG: SDR family NAD(P)-dependent oxidoreductase [Desulfomonilaceae bacterium]